MLFVAVLHSGLQVAVATGLQGSGSATPWVRASGRSCTPTRKAVRTTLAGTRSGPRSPGIPTAFADAKIGFRIGLRGLPYAGVVVGTLRTNRSLAGQQRKHWAFSVPFSVIRRRPIPIAGWGRAEVPGRFWKFRAEFPQSPRLVLWQSCPSPWPGR